MKRPIFGAATLVAFASVPALAQQFVYNAAALPAQTVWTNGIELADVDGDGDIDAICANGSSYGAGGSQPQHLFLNNGTGTFTAAHAQLNVANFNAQMVIAEDFDNDGDKDLMYAPSGPYPSPTALPKMLINNGLGVFNDQSATRLPAIPMSAFCVCAGDIDNDGDLDVVFTDGASSLNGTAAQSHLYLNNGSGFFTDATATNLPSVIYNCQDVTLGDWDADFDIDIILTGKGGGSRLLVNDGTGHFTLNTVLNSSGTSLTYEGDPADLDGDGDLDIAMQSISGLNEGWVRNNGATVTNVTFSGTNGADDNEMAAFDYDNDGDLDVMVASLAFSSEKAYNNNGNVFTFANIFQAQTDSSLDFGFADLNGDKKYDMYTAQGESGNFTDKVYFNNGPADTIKPTIQATNSPVSIGAGGTVFKARVRDAIVDDGHINATARLVYATNDGAGGVSGVATAINQGCGLFRAAAPSSGATTAVSSAWVVTDSAKNTSVTATSQIGGANGWATQTAGKTGANGVPALVGAGDNSANSAGVIGLFSARGNTTAILMIGTSPGNVALFGGTLLPFPIVAQVALTTNANGDVVLPYVFPAGVPAGVNIYLQYVIQDAAATQSVSFSNGLVLTTK